MTLWLDEELAGDLRVHLEKQGADQVDASLRHMGRRIEQMLESQGLVSRRSLISASQIE
jgi:hypothetical protein